MIPLLIATYYVFKERKLEELFYGMWGREGKGEGEGGMGGGEL
jgi:hypothetical protein